MPVLKAELMAATFLNNFLRNRRYLCREFDYCAEKNVKFTSGILLNGRQPSVYTVLNPLDKQNSAIRWLVAPTTDLLILKKQ